MDYEVIVIGAGLSGLTAASLLAKRGMHVLVIDKAYSPGGSCGIFKRDGMIFDQGASMLYGFGERGFNPHRFVFNCLEEPIDVIRHEFLYTVNYKGKRVKFWPNVEMFALELAELFPEEKDNIRRFYRDSLKLYNHVMVEHPVFSTPDENDGKESMDGFKKHPLSYLKFMGYMNKNTDTLLRKYFSDPEIFKFFDKLTSTYCYTSVEETPAILSAIMFVDNHVGGSYYPAGSTLFLPGKLEKVIEENGGKMLMEKEVEKLLFENEKPVGVKLTTGETYRCRDIVYSGTVWNLYEKLLVDAEVPEERMKWAKDLVPTYPSVVLYAYVDRSVIPELTMPVEMLVGNPDLLDQNEVTVYIPSIDDHTLCAPDGHVIEAIGPTLENWAGADEAGYAEMKERERVRLIAVLEKRFPGFTEAVRFSEVATPRSIERYTMKKGGAVAGPKQMLGQHMFHRLHTKSEWESLYYCGESTVMGTGTPTVTISGLSAANAILKKRGFETFRYRKDMKDHVTTVRRPFEPEDRYEAYPEEMRDVMVRASRCFYCEHPQCMAQTLLDIRGIMRRVTVTNLKGARNLAEGYLSGTPEVQDHLKDCEALCIRNRKTGEPVEIRKVLSYLGSMEKEED